MWTNITFGKVYKSLIVRIYKNICRIQPMQVPLFNTLPIQPAFSQYFSPNTKAYTQFNATPWQPPSIQAVLPCHCHLLQSYSSLQTESKPISSVGSQFSLPILWAPYTPWPILVKLALRTIIYFLALLIHCLMCMYILFLPTSQHQDGKNHVLIYICIWFFCYDKSGIYSIDIQ